MLTTVFAIGGVALFMLLGVVGYLLIIASSRASRTEARVQALLREARADQAAAGALGGRVIGAWHQNHAHP